MGSCMSAEAAAASAASREIDKALKLEMKATEQNIKLLLLGAGETGKSTVLKQIKLIHGTGYTEEDRIAYRVTILTNIITCAKTLLNATEVLKIPYGFDPSTVDINQLQLPEDWEPIPKSIVDAIAVVWKDSGVQYCYRRANEYQLIDCCAVFLNDLDRLCHPTFLPTDQDILNSRVMTTTIIETRFKIEGIIFRVFDVGGQRSERKKWAPYFDDINAIIYLVAINSYDQICFEDNSTNRMVESMNLFASICNHPMFKKTAMIIFMNKIDLFRAKLETTLISDYFPTYDGKRPNDYDNGSEYFATRFLSLNKYEKKIYVHFTWATDTKQIKTVLAIVNQIILR
ncbi:G protein alpha subunit [Obelidium mucronatum]|nr:G protein alpha subunit [Obelidium mucronatum]